MKNALGDIWEDELDRSKWTLWHGNAKAALIKLDELEEKVKQPKISSHLTELYDFIARNKKYLVNYDELKKSGQIFTSQTAESHVESLINARHKRSRKMQWNRESAHNVLQIRSKQASNEWNSQWQRIVLTALGVPV